MATQTVRLRPVTREDVSRLRRWLEDDEVSESWFGRYAYGDPAHLGYHPDEMEKASDAEWIRVFNDTEHRILSIYTSEGEHVGEVHVAIEGEPGRRPPVDTHRAQGHVAPRVRYGRRAGDAQALLRRLGAVPRVGGRP